MDILYVEVCGYIELYSSMAFVKPNRKQAHLFMIQVPCETCSAPWLSYAELYIGNIEYSRDLL